ncbi:putative serine threonine protein kinase [Cladorrhinum sp. PSN259]|nr:putative serine threonine protein kinase [Cladorrhinum sp. PSN259]
MILLGSFRRIGGDETKYAKWLAHHNPEFLFNNEDATNAWMGCNTSEALQCPFFALPLEKTRMPKNNNAYILGSLDPEQTEQAGKSHLGGRAKDSCPCDFALDEDNQTGISRKALSIDLYPQQSTKKQTVVRVGVLAHNVRYALQGSTMKEAYIGKHFGVPQDSSVLINIASLEFRIWVPTLTPSQHTRRGELAHAFDLEAHRNPPLHLPSIHVGVNTSPNHIRTGTSKANRIYFWTGKASPVSTKSRPFFTIWSPPNHKRSAWQPVVQPNSPDAVVEIEVSSMKRYCDSSRLLPKHPNIYHFHEMAIYTVKDENPDNLPWAVGEYIHETTQTLAAQFDLQAAGKTPLAATQRLSIFHQICNAISHAHLHNVAYGSLNASWVLLTPPKVGEEAVVQAYTVKIFGFNNNNPPYSGTDSYMKRDNIALGRLGVLLLADWEVDLYNKQPNKSEDWVLASQSADKCIQALLEALVCGRFTSQNAKHFVSGLLIDESAASNLARGIEEQWSAKRKKTISPPVPTKPAKRMCKHKSVRFEGSEESRAPSRSVAETPQQARQISDGSGPRRPTQRASLGDDRGAQALATDASEEQETKSSSAALLDQEQVAKEEQARHVVVYEHVEENKISIASEPSLTPHADEWTKRMAREQKH